MSLRVEAEGDAVASVQAMLNAAGVVTARSDGTYGPLVVDGKFGSLTQQAVVAFQEQFGLLADGVVGPITLQALEDETLAAYSVAVSPGADSVDELPERVPFEKVAADAWGEGYGHVWLRADVAERYRRVLDAVHQLGGKLTSSGGKRALWAKVGPARSATSFHYTGRALDLYLYSGMVNPEKDPYVVTRDEGLYHRVFARCADDQGEELELERVVAYNNRDGTLATRGRFVDLTALFKEQGFERIGARPSFHSGGSQLGAEWWHFQDQTGLVEGASTFGAELLRVYSETSLRGSPPWRYRDQVFGINWR